MELSWLMGCDAVLYLLPYPERPRGAAGRGPGRWPRCPQRPSVPRRPARAGRGPVGTQGPGRRAWGAGRAPMAERGHRGPGRLEWHTHRGAQAAINLKSLGILLAFSKYY